MARGFLCFEDKKQVDIVHSEVCSLHINPSLHATDQLVTQSLFADGFIKYSAVPTTTSPHFKILGILEEIIPNSTEAMTWDVVDWGHQMTLAKEVPVLIRRHLPQSLERLCQKTHLSKNILKQALFAIHPGGPRILLQMQELLQLSDTQMTYSFEILKSYGNMSSATLPHIWQAVLNDPNIPSGVPIVSLAFGPGLSISGSIMEKQCGS
jgi:predicted naringenin-chalcone synthase